MLVTEARIKSAIGNVIVPLDTTNAEEAVALVTAMSAIGVECFKVGITMECALGLPQAVALVLAAGGKKVFVDKKLHDIPFQVEGAAAAIAALDGVYLLNVHGCGGKSMMEAAMVGAIRAAKESGKDRPLVIAVTVLTSMDADEAWNAGFRGTPREQTLRIAQLADICGLDGVVCSPEDTEAVRAVCRPGFVIVNPGIRPEDSELGDQRRTGTPGGAMAAGATQLVIGRPITGAKDQQGALLAIATEMVENGS